MAMQISDNLLKAVMLRGVASFLNDAASGVAPMTTEAMEFLYHFKDKKESEHAVQTSFRMRIAKLLREEVLSDRAFQVEAHHGRFEAKAPSMMNNLPKSVKLVKDEVPTLMTVPMKAPSLEEVLAASAFEASQGQQVITDPLALMAAFPEKISYDLGASETPEAAPSSEA